MKERPYRAALIGCGRIASSFAAGDGTLGIYTHAEAYRACPRTELVAVCDVDPARAEACARQWNVPSWYTDGRKMMREVTPDIVSLCTPDGTHESLALDVLAAAVAPRGLLCEKPLALEVEGARRVVAAARSAGAALVVNYMRRYADNLRAVRDLVRSGELGAVQAVQGWYTKGVLHNGTHWFDLLRYLAGDVRTVVGHMVRGGDSDDPELDVSLSLVSGARAQLTSCEAGCFTVFEMDLVLERGRVELRDAALQPRLWKARPSTRFVGYTELVEDGRDFGTARDALLHAVEDLVEAVATGRPAACSGEDGLAALEVGAAAVTSARGGATPVRIDARET